MYVRGGKLQVWTHRWRGSVRVFASSRFGESPGIPRHVPRFFSGANGRNNTGWRRMCPRRGAWERKDIVSSEMQCHPVALFVERSKNENSPADNAGRVRPACAILYFSRSIFPKRVSRAVVSPRGADLGFFMRFSPPPR